MGSPSHAFPHVVVLGKGKYEAAGEKLTCYDVLSAVRVDASSSVEKVGGDFVAAKHYCVLTSEVNVVYGTYRLSTTNQPGDCERLTVCLLPFGELVPGSVVEV